MKIVLNTGPEIHCFHYALCGIMISLLKEIKGKYPEELAVAFSMHWITV